MSVLLFVIILGLLVFIHELGHFLAARRSGVRVEEFGFGFPPRLYGRQRGQTLYSINLIPFGGFVRLAGEQKGDPEVPGSFQAISLPRKILVMAAGVVMNYGLAWIILTAVLAAGVTVDPTLTKVDAGATLTNRQTQALVTADGAADRAGMQTGDTIRSINNHPFTSTTALAAYARQENFPPLTVQFERDGRSLEKIIKPNQTVEPAAPHYDFGLTETAVLNYPWYSAPWAGLRSTVSLSWQSVVGFGQVLAELVSSGQLSPDVAGPVGIAVLTGEVSRLGWVSLFQFTALLSISLAVINFLPIPALDGGRAFLLVVQKVFRTTINPRVENYIHASGFYILIVMILLISIRDVQRFNIVDRVVNIFR